VRRTLRIPADLAELAPVRHLLADALERRGWSDDDAWRVLLAVQEALVNAVEHGSTAGDVVEVRISVRRDRAHVRLRDGGRPGASSPSGPAVAPPAGQAHGRGRLIMQALADAVDSRASGSGTRVGLAFLRRSPG
jgi:anti-sigma regulatory factor (Ser/Thr protein kinase)